MPLLTLWFACTTPTDVETTSYLTPWESDGVAGTDAFVIPGDPELTAQVWYPAEATGPVATYDGVPLGDARHRAPARCEQARPVVMFSHGNGGLRYQSVFLTEHLARRGYVVAAPDHAFNTTFDDSIETAEIAVRRPLDIQRTFDALVERSNDPGDALAGCVDEDAGYVAMGHSFGGYTSFALAGAQIDLEAVANGCQGFGGFLCDMDTYFTAAFPGDPGTALQDDRVWAAVPLSPAGIVALSGGLDRVQVPTLVLNGELDELTTMPAVTSMYERLEVSPAYLGELLGTGHYSFTDFCISGAACLGEGIDHDESKRLINGLVTAFLDDVREVPGADAWVGFDDPNVRWTAR